MHDDALNQGGMIHDEFIFVRNISTSSQPKKTKLRLFALKTQSKREAKKK